MAGTTIPPMMISQLAGSTITATQQSNAGNQQTIAAPALTAASSNFAQVGAGAPQPFIDGTTNNGRPNYTLCTQHTLLAAPGNGVVIHGAGRFGSGNSAGGGGNGMGGDDSGNPIEGAFRAAHNPAELLKTIIPAAESWLQSFNKRSADPAFIKELETNLTRFDVRLLAQITRMSDRLTPTKGLFFLYRMGALPKDGDATAITEAYLASAPAKQLDAQDQLEMERIISDALLTFSIDYEAIHHRKPVSAKLAAFRDQLALERLPFLEAIDLVAKFDLVILCRVFGWVSPDEE